MKFFAIASLLFSFSVVAFADNGPMPVNNEPLVPVEKSELPSPVLNVWGPCSPYCSKGHACFVCLDNTGWCERATTWMCPNTN
jgi:hypothetical protein